MIYPESGQSNDSRKSVKSFCKLFWVSYKNRASTDSFGVPLWNLSCYWSFRRRFLHCLILRKISNSKNLRNPILSFPNSALSKKRRLSF